MLPRSDPMDLAADDGAPHEKIPQRCGPRDSSSSASAVVFGRVQYGALKNLLWSDEGHERHAKGHAERHAKGHAAMAGGSGAEETVTFRTRDPPSNLRVRVVLRRVTAVRYVVSGSTPFLVSAFILPLGSVVIPPCCPSLSHSLASVFILPLMSVLKRHL